MHTEDLIVDDGGQAEVVEDLRAVAPHVHAAVLLQTLVVEAIHLRNLAGLVVTTNKSYSVGIPYL